MTELPAQLSHPISLLTYGQTYEILRDFYCCRSALTSEIARLKLHQVTLAGDGEGQSVTELIRFLEAANGDQVFAKGRHNWTNKPETQKLMLIVVWKMHIATDKAEKAIYFAARDDEGGPAVIRTYRKLDDIDDLVMTKTSDTTFDCKRCNSNTKIKILMRDYIKKGEEGGPLDVESYGHKLDRRTERYVKDTRGRI